MKREIVLMFALGFVTAMQGSAQLLEPRLTAFGGSGFSTQASQVPLQLGGSFDMGLLPTPVDGMSIGPLLEGGYLRPAAVTSGAAYFSTDAMLLRDPHLSQGASSYFAVGGYSLLVDAGNAVNFGVGTDRAWRASDTHYVRFDVRDQYAPATGRHTVLLRIGFVKVSRFTFKPI